MLTRAGAGVGAEKNGAMARAATHAGDNRRPTNDREAAACGAAEGAGNEG